MEPLHTHLEYCKAYDVANQLESKLSMVGLSLNEVKEYDELVDRIKDYETKIEQIHAKRSKYPD